MFKLSDFCNNSESSDDDKESKFIRFLTQKWDKIHDQSDVFRYKIINLQEKIVDNKYLLQLNPFRCSNRRQPEQIQDISQPFDKNKFNFTKASHKEVILKITDENELHTLLVNVSPISRYHSLLCPSIDRCLPQIVTEDSLELSIKIMFLAQNRDLRIGFNSSCAMASVNHLHYHLFMEKTSLPIESAPCTHLHRQIYIITDHPVPAFCFEVLENCKEFLSKEIYKLVQYLLEKKIAHNIFMTRGNSVKPGLLQEVLRVIIWPRRSSSVVKQLGAFNVAVCELSGWFPVYNAVDYDNLQSVHIEHELSKWKIDNFKEICDEIKQIM